MAAVNCFDVDKNYTMRTCSPLHGKGRNSMASFHVNGYGCYENDAFIPEYCATSCYCTSDKCNNFAAPPLSEEGNRKVQRSSCLTASSLTILLGVLMTTL